MRVVIVGPGRAGGAMAIASTRAGHELVGVLSRSGAGPGPVVEWDRPLPEADLVLLAVRDEAIVEVAGRLAPYCRGVAVAAHLSGFMPVTTLRPLAEAGVSIGGLHPLQTFPDAERGAAAVAGSFAGIGGEPLAVDVLTLFAVSVGMEVFLLDDVMRPAYHAAAAAASGFVVAALSLAADLFAGAGVDPAVARPLVEHSVANVYQAGEALTGPIVRGDIETVVGHLTAARQVSEDVGRVFRLMAEATAIRAGRADQVARWT